MATSSFDIGIIGGGVSGLHLALALLNDSHFDKYSIAIFEKSPKTVNDKTWSFWEDGKGKWDHLITKEWKRGKIFAQQEEVELNLQPFTYKMLPSINFYTYAYQQIENAEHMHLLYEAVLDLKENTTSVEILTATENYSAQLVFNSQIPSIKDIRKKADFTLLQHFKGWFIETNKPVFNPEEFVMMDYRYKEKDQTSFMYVLPISSTKALVEYTYFTPHLVNDERYEHFLKKYIKEKLAIEEYQITDTEQGIIPMSTYNFNANSTQKIIQIGTAGGWVKASSGYSFKNAEKKAAKLVANLKNNQPLSQGLFQPKYKHYDALFLDVLCKHNALGELVFYKLYAKNNIQTLLKFLDEDTSFAEDFKIIQSLTSMVFIKAFFRHVLRELK